MGLVCGTHRNCCVPGALVTRGEGQRMCSEGVGNSGRGGVGNRVWEDEHTDCSGGRGEGGIQNEARSSAWRTGMRRACRRQRDPGGGQPGTSRNELLWGPECCTVQFGFAVKAEGHGNSGKTAHASGLETGSKGEGWSWKDHVTCIRSTAWFWWLRTREK